MVVAAREKSLVEEAVEAKKFVVVADVPVAVVKVTLWSVEEELVRRLPKAALAENRLVEEAVVANEFVVVALVEVDLRKVIF